MKRRDLIKASIAALASCSLFGCKKDEAQGEAYITPKQTGIYEFSAGLPFNYELIDEIAEINSANQNFKVATLYNNTPLPVTENYNSWIMILRGKNNEFKGHQDFIKYAKYAMDKGFEICYLMNSPKPFSKQDFDTFKDDFYYLLDLLHDNGINHIKVGNTQVAELINSYKHSFRLSASTTFEYHNTSQYINLVKNFPNFDTFDIAIDENHNFQFLKNLRKIFPDKKIELMVNETCIKGCPARISHLAEIRFCLFNCELLTANVGERIFKMPAIFPWDLGYYSAIGINNFKLIARKNHRANIISNDYIKSYLNSIKNGTDNYNLNDFLYNMYAFKDKIKSDSATVSHIIPYLPDIKYFTKYGHLCAARCGATCDRCMKKAEELEEVLKIIRG